MQTLVMPVYQSRKIVQALKIASVEADREELANVAVIGFEDRRFPPIHVNLEKKPTPQAGWYFVQYDDGYSSFSPGPQFEKGNVPIETVFANAARAAHEATRIVVFAKDVISIPPWDEAPEGMKADYIEGVKRIWENPVTDDVPTLFSIVARAALGL